MSLLKRNYSAQKKVGVERSDESVKNYEYLCAPTTSFFDECRQ